jgi:hypothetical protein
MTTGWVLREGWARLRTRAAFAVVAIWLVVTVVALAIIAPAWAWWSGALAHTIDGARLLGSPNVATLAELFRDSPYGLRTILAAALAGATLMLVLNPFLAGGLLGALVGEPVAPRRGRVARFAADGVGYYGPLLRVALIVWPIAAAVIAAGAIVAALPFAAGATPVLSLAASGAVVVAGALGATMLVDLARARVVHTGSRRAGAAVVAALGIAGRHLPRLVLVALAFGVAFAAAGAALVAIRAGLAGDTWPSILLGLAAQQAYAFGRTWLRAALMSSELVVVSADAEARALAAASVATGEERPEVFVVVQGEPGEGGLVGEEGRGGGDLAPEVGGRLATEGDGRRGDAEAEEAGPALPALAGDRRRDEPPPVA